MNRSLVIPAVCCLVAFAALLTTLHGAPGREVNRRTPAAAAAFVEGEHALNTYYASGNARLLPADEAQRLLTSLGGEYLRPWRQWEKSPSRLYSRAGPRPIPSMSAEIELAREATGESDSFLLATIAIHKGAHTQSVPCVVDRITKRVRLFADGKWVTEDEWLKTAPLF